MSKVNQSWGGRFNKASNKIIEDFGASVKFDKILAKYDIKASIAHAKMLGQCKIITKKESDTIIIGLEQIIDEINQNKFKWLIEKEDVHMNIESRLIEICGDVGKKLHTGRSRNDQIATDIRLYLRSQTNDIINLSKDLQVAILALAQNHTNTIMPGFTHLQVAQPVVFAHHLMAYFEMINRDVQRLKDSLKRINFMPLGAAALAGTTYPIDRDLSAKLLGFDNICANSIDAVSDRDFLIEFMACASIMMMHLSRFCEEIIIWSSAQFNFIELTDDFASGSSIMPNKKNPDVVELIRGKTGRVYGSLVALLTIMKGQVLAYNKDNQEDKEPIFDTVNTLKTCIDVFTRLMYNLKINEKNMLNATKKGHITATDLADYLVNKKVAFRDAHKIAGQAVLYSIKQNKDLSELSLQELQKISKIIKQDVFEVLDLKNAVYMRNHIGATSPKQVKKAIKTAKNSLKN